MWLKVRSISLLTCPRNHALVVRAYLEINEPSLGKHLWASEKFGTKITSPSTHPLLHVQQAFTAALWANIILGHFFVRCFFVWTFFPAPSLLETHLVSFKTYYFWNTMGLWTRRWDDLQLLEICFEVVLPQSVEWIYSRGNFQFEALSSKMLFVPGLVAVVRQSWSRPWRFGSPWRYLFLSLLFL